MYILSVVLCSFQMQGLKYPGMPRISDDPGKILVLNLLTETDPTELHIKGDFDAESFGPHGISVYTNEAGMWIC